MPIANLITNAFIKVEHITVDSGNSNTEGYVADIGLAAVPVNIQPSSNEVTALNGGMYGKGYTAFVTQSGILETDRLTLVSGTASTQFIVRGKQYYNYGFAQHLELYMEEVL